jgi:hypothetical protein
VTDGDITWGQMWAEEERQRQAAAESAWGQQVPLDGPLRQSEADEGLTLAPEPYFGEQAPHHPEPQPYFEYSADPVEAEAETQPPAPRVTLPAAPPPRLWDRDKEPVEGLDELDWQAPPPPATEPPEPQPSPQDREWESTWADGIHKPRHAK